MAAAAKRKLAKVAAADLVQRGLINNRDVEFTNCQWVYFDYIAKGGKKLDLEHRPVGFEATLVALDDATVVESARWKIGDERYYEPEGAALYALGDSDGAASKSSNFGIFMAAMDAAGLPADLQASLAENAAALDGLKGHLVRQKIERGGQDSTGREMKDSEVPVLTSIIAMPGTKAAPKSRGGAKAKASAKAAAADESSVGELSPEEIEEVSGYILTAIRQNGDEVDAEALPGMVMSVMIAERVPMEKRKALRDWIRDQGESLTVSGMAFGGGHFALTE